jgi:hypothetical protein
LLSSTPIDLLAEKAKQRGAGGEGVRQMWLKLLNNFHLSISCPSPCPCQNV